MPTRDRGRELSAFGRARGVPLAILGQSAAGLHWPAAGCPSFTVKKLECLKQA